MSGTLEPEPAAYDTCGHLLVDVVYDTHGVEILAPRSGAGLIGGRNLTRKCGLHLLAADELQDKPSDQSIDVPGLPATEMQGGASPAALYGPAVVQRFVGPTM